MNHYNILVASQPCVLGYFNAGHHISLYEVVAYLRKLGNTVTSLDASATLNSTWKDVPIMLRKNNFDVVVVLNDFDVVEGFQRFVEYIHEFSPQSKIVTFGRLSSRLPAYYKQFDIDGIVCDGDYEAGIAQFMAYMNGSGYPAGVSVRENGQWIQPQHDGLFLSAEEWVLPNVNEVPYASYGILYSDDARKFCGVPEKMELVIPVARGCPIRCDFCEVWTREGLNERRLSVQRTIDYINESFGKLPFEYVSFYAPTFTLKKSWVLELCSAMKKQGVKHPWKCTTTQFHLDENLIKSMAEAGCFRISVGVETFEQGVLDNLPAQKRQARRQFDDIYTWCRKVGIELNCFVVVGLPDTTVEGTQATFDYLKKDGIRIRPSVYSDYDSLAMNMSEDDAVRILGRHILPERSGFSVESRSKLYDLVFGRDVK